MLLSHSYVEKVTYHLRVRPNVASALVDRDTRNSTHNYGARATAEINSSKRSDVFVSGLQSLHFLVDETTDRASANGPDDSAGR